ncbi:MAG: hypothetical protein RI947_1472, partial [Candidatus Parcubacteria bacterium]
VDRHEERNRPHGDHTGEAVLPVDDTGF